MGIIKADPKLLEVIRLERKVIAMFQERSRLFAEIPEKVSYDDFEVLKGMAHEPFMICEDKATFSMPSGLAKRVAELDLALYVINNSLDREEVNVAKQSLADILSKMLKDIEFVEERAGIVQAPKIKLADVEII